ncbi:MAG: cysteine desulfurase [Bacteroidetes bacterium]|jgi:cysteine desulfurase/selenocysteine lyase|nr:cysteine desulfurase [Bacteroidota bacterium]
MPANTLSNEQTVAGVFDAEAIREEFPILERRVHGRPLVYLDNAATTQKPLPVLRAEDSYYRTLNSNVHRGVHRLSEEATEAYEASRESVRRYLNAASTQEIVFVRGTTEAINLVAATFGRTHLAPGDVVLISGLEHHSNIVPWQMVCAERGATLSVIPIDDRGQLRMDEFGRLLTDRVKIVAVNHVSNALGTVNPVREIVAKAHARSIPVLLDGAQALPHGPVDVRELECDFYAFSGHKVFGPTGIGVLYGRSALLGSLPPYQGGGDMIRSVTFEKTVYNDLPYRFEAGTPNIAGSIGLGAALDYLWKLDWPGIRAHERDLLSYATEQISTVPGIRLIGTAEEKVGVLSFVLQDVHPHDIGTILDQEGIAIRTGHHCAQPVMIRFGIPATARASFAFYNTKAEVDALVEGVRRVREVMGV